MIPAAELRHLVADGQTATYNGRSVKGWLRDEFELAALGSVGVEARSQVFRCLAVDVEGVAHGDTLAIAGVSYTVRGVRPDGLGLVRLVLEEA
jgi:hypothetical protein